MRTPGEPRTWWHKLQHRFGWNRGEVVSWKHPELGEMIGFQCTECGKIVGPVAIGSLIDQQLRAYLLEADAAKPPAS